MRSRIYEHLKAADSYGLSIKEISLTLRIKTSTVTGRLDELMDEGLVTRKKWNGTGNRYKASMPKNVKFFKQLRAAQKMEVWLKKGIARYSNLISDDAKKELKKAVSKAYEKAMKCQ